MNPTLVPGEVDGIEILAGKVRYVVGAFLVAERTVDVRGCRQPLVKTVRAAVPGVAAENVKRVVTGARSPGVRGLINAAFPAAAILRDFPRLSHPERQPDSPMLTVAVTFASSSGQTTARWTTTLGTFRQTTEMVVPSGRVDEHTAEILWRAARQFPGLDIDLVTEEQSIVDAKLWWSTFSPRAAVLLRDLQAKYEITISARHRRPGSSARSEARS